MTRNIMAGVLATLWLVSAQASDLPRTPSPAGAEVYIITPKSGATVSSPVTVRFGLKGMGIAPAGTKKDNTGHHHLLIDGSDLPPDNLPMGAQVKHFGAGQTEVSVELSPGEHTLQLILGDALHIQHDPPVISERISITVE